MKNKGAIIGILAIVFLAIVFWWNGKETNGKETKGIIKVGVILPLTGEAAAYGNAGKNGIELAVRELNQKEASNIKFDVYFEDNQGQPKNAVTAFEALKTKVNPIVVIGPISSPEVLAVAPIAEKNKIVLITPGASSPKISEAGDYIFRNVPSDIYEPSIMAEYLVKNKKRVALIYVNNDYGNGVKEVFSRKLKELGVELVETQTYLRESKSFISQLEKIKKNNPDVVYIIGYKELGNLLKQASEINLKTNFYSNSLFEDYDILKTAGSSSEGVIFTTFPFDVNSEDIKIKNFVTAFETKYKTKPDGFAVVAYEAIKLINQAILNEDGQISSDNIKNGLYKIKDYNGLIGDISFDQNGDITFPINLKIVEDNKFRNLKK